MKTSVHRHRSRVSLGLALVDWWSPGCSRESKLVAQLGRDPSHSGIMIVVNPCIGLRTPPVGQVLFVGGGIVNTSITKVIRPLLPRLFGC